MGLLRRILEDRRGVTALEFAFFLPILAVLAAGTLEFGRLILVTQKVQTSAFTIADLAARDRDITEGQIDNIFLAVDNIMQPFDFETNGRAYLSAVGAPLVGPADVLWQRSTLGPTGASGGVGPPGGDAALPATVVLAPAETLIVAEVAFDYRTMFGLTALDHTVRRSAYFRPRLGTLNAVLP